MLGSPPLALPRAPQAVHAHTAGRPSLQPLQLVVPSTHPARWCLPRPVLAAPASAPVCMRRTWFWSRRYPFLKPGLPLNSGLLELFPPIGDADRWGLVVKILPSCAAHTPRTSKSVS